MEIKKYALVVDDEESTRLFCKGFAEKAGFEVHTAANGDKALELLVKLESKGLDLRKISVVVSDTNMPGMGGADFLWNIQYSLPCAYRIQMSGKGKGSVFADLFVKKPFSGIKLMEQMKEGYKLYVERAKQRGYNVKG